MPKLFGLNLVGVLAATVAFYVVGMVWYGFAFSDLWMSAAGLTEADFEGQSPVWMLGGVLVTFAQVVGIGLVLKWKGVGDIGAAIKTALILWLVFALPFVHYAYIYSPDHNSTMLMIDAGHLLVGWVISAIVLSFFK